MVGLFYHGGGYIFGDNQYVLVANADDLMDVFGVIGEDGTNTAWEYLDAWAWRAADGPNYGDFGPCGEPNSNGFTPSEGTCPGWKIADKDCSDNSVTNCNDADPVNQHWKHCNFANNANAPLATPSTPAASAL